MVSQPGSGVNYPTLSVRQQSQGVASLHLIRQNLLGRAGLVRGIQTFIRHRNVGKQSWEGGVKPSGWKTLRLRTSVVLASYPTKGGG